VITLNDIEHFYPELLKAKANRSKVEYYFTLSPVLPLYILENYDCDRITTLDADIYFYSDPTEIFSHYHPNDVLITPHDFSSNIKQLEEYGYYNVSFQSFPRTIDSINILNDWKARCISWCYDVLDPDTGNYADQKYLDFWKINFENVQDINLKTCGRAPWNIKDTKLQFKKGKILANDKLLVYYHFHHLRIYGKMIEHGLLLYGVSEITTELKIIYEKYLRRLIYHNRLLLAVNDRSIIRYNNSNDKRNVWYHIWEIELGAFSFSGSPYFFDIRLIKRIYNYIKRKLNA
jgi:hypothetical protein